MTCIVCKTKFFDANYMDTAESCDCGSCVDALAYQCMDWDEQQHIDRKREAWQVACERCLERTGEINAGTKDKPSDEYMCDGCRQDYAEKMDEAKFTDYWSGYTAEDGRER